MFFVRPDRQKKNLIYDKFYQNIPKVLLDYSIIFIQICAKFLLCPKWVKIKPLNEHILITQNGNLQAESAIL